jgi:phage tail-like protein
MGIPIEIFLHVQGPDDSWTYQVPEGKTSIGRQATCDVCLPQPLVSRQHAILTRTGEESTLEDIGSANGTVVNGENLEPHTPFPLADGGTFYIGPYKITYQEKEVTPQEQEEILVPQVQTTSILPGSIDTVQEEKQELLEQVEIRWTLPPGLALESRHFANYLPGIYQTDFMNRFLALFESIFVPIEWTIDNFDLFLDPGTALKKFLPWLANWYEIVFDSTWSESQQRSLLLKASEIYARRGTRWALSQLLEIYTGCAPEIIEFEEGIEPFSFKIRLALPEQIIHRNLIEQIVDLNKPVHTTYHLEFL